MGLFSSKSSKPTYIGVDVGYSGIKLVELANESGKSRLVTYAYVDMPATSIEKPFMDETDKIADLIKKMVAKARCTSKRAISALPGSSVFSSIVSVPAASGDELKEAIQLQARKLIPVPLEDINLDSKVIEPNGDDGGKKVTRVLMTGAPKALVGKYIEVFKRANLELLSLETETFAQIRSLIGKDRSTIMLIDMGSQRTNVTIVEKGVPFMTRSIASGGYAVTQMIAKTLGIPYEQADSMKRDIRALQSFAPAGDINPMLGTLLKPIIDEVKYSFTLYQGQADGAQTPAKRIDKIILTGGSALLPRLSEYFTQLMNVNTYLGDPWARVVYPPDMRPILDEIGSRFTIAIGCAMRDIE